MIILKTWVSSDHHFDHYKILAFSQRPFGSIKQMNDEMIRRWNITVSPDDVVIHLGDFALSGRRRIKELRSQLNGTIFLILGNHDGSKRTMEKCGFIVSPTKTVTIGSMIFSHKPLPFRETNGCINIHGHIHHFKNKDRKHINAGVDVTNFYPVNIEHYRKLSNKILER